jgi:hypothetical protein
MLWYWPSEGNIDERGDRVYAGIDPVSGRQSYLRETIPGTGYTAWRKAEDKLAEFRAQVLLKQHKPGVLRAIQQRRRRLASVEHQS